MSDVTDVVRVPSRIGTGWGFAIMLLGMLALMTPFVSGVAVTVVVAVFVTAAGLAMTVYAFKAGSLGKGIMQFLFGGITILCGILMFSQPFISMWTMTAVLMAYFLVDGIFSIVAGVRGRPQPGWGWVIVSGIASIVLAVLLWSKWPASGEYAIGLLVGVRLIFSGWSIAMLGMLGDDAVDVASGAAQQRPASSG